MHAIVVGDSEKLVHCGSVLSGTSRSFLPWDIRRQLGTTPPSFSTRQLQKREVFWDSLYVGGLQCHQLDEYEDLSGEESTYIYAVQFSPLEGQENLLAIANEDGRVLIQDTNVVGPDSYLTSFDAHNNAIFDVAWVPGKPGLIATASGDQSVRVWDFSSYNSENVEAIRTFRAYSRSVKCVEFAPDSSDIMATGSRENSILLWDMRCPSDQKPLLSIKRAHKTYTSGHVVGRHSTKKEPIGTCSVTAVQFQDQQTLVSSSDTDGIIKIWDLRMSYDRYSGDPQPKHKIPFPGKSSLRGYTSLLLNAARTNLYASCKDNHIYKFDLAGYNEKVLNAFSGYENGSKFFIRMSLSCDDRYLASGSSDNKAYVWNVSSVGPTTPIYSLEGHESEVTCVDWSRKGWRLATCSDDLKHRIWRLRGPHEIEKGDLNGEAVKIETTLYPDLSAVPSNSFATKRRIVVVDQENVSLNIPPPNKRMRGNGNKSVEVTPTKKKPESPARKLKSFPCSPRKMNVTSPAKRSNCPRKLLLSPIKQSPTANLPNMVLDGKSPYAKSTRKSSASKKPLDWLTSLSRQKKMHESTSPMDTKTTPKAKTAGRGGSRRGSSVKKSLDMSK